MRAIVIKFKLSSGTRVKVVFDRYGHNAKIFADAAREGWDVERMTSQMISNALAAVMTYHPGDKIEDYSLIATD